MNSRRSRPYCCPVRLADIVGKLASSQQTAICTMLLNRLSVHAISVVLVGRTGQEIAESGVNPASAGCPFRRAAPVRACDNWRRLEMKKQYSIAAASALVTGLLSTAALAQEAATVAFLMPDQASTRYEEHDFPGFKAAMDELCPDCTVVYQNA